MLVLGIIKSRKLWFCPTMWWTPEQSSLFFERPFIYTEFDMLALEVMFDNFRYLKYILAKNMWKMYYMSLGLEHFIAWILILCHGRLVCWPVSDQACHNMVLSPRMEGRWSVKSLLQILEKYLSVHYSVFWVVKNYAKSYVPNQKFVCHPKLLKNKFTVIIIIVIIIC
jgi:hypothetical protein